MVMKIVERKQYLDQLVSLIGTPDIKVITGIRRSGKSVLLNQFGDYLRTVQPDANLIRVDLNSADNRQLLDCDSLYNYITSHYIDGRHNFVFIDEVQMCANFERAINWLHNSQRYDIYVTDSNAFLLSSDLATLFTGRTYEVKIFPFSFREYCDYFGKTDLSSALADYFTDGGMPGSYAYHDPQQRRDYIANIFDTLIVRDIVERYKVQNVHLLNTVADYMLDNIANQTSMRNMVNMLPGEAGINHKTVGNYVSYLTNAYAFYRISRYDIKGKKYLASQDKYYLADHSFKIAKLGTKNADYGHVYENMVAIELLRRGYEIYVGAWHGKEIDFVALKPNEQIYIQVADYLDNPVTAEREYAPLLQINDAYPKVVLANTHHNVTTHEGIRIIDLAQWLAGQAGLTH